MATNRTQNQWTFLQRFLPVACLIIFIPLTIAALVVIALIPVYLTNRAIYFPRSTVAPPFNVTYVLVDPSIRSSSDLNLGAIDRVRMARSFERALDLRVQNVLQIRGIYPNTAIGMNSRSRRKRFVQCDRDLRGPVLIFDFNLIYPINRICRSQKCIEQTFADIYQQFRSGLSILVDFDNVLRELRLCSFGVNPFTIINSSTRVTPSISSTQDSTTMSSLNEGSTTSVLIPGLNTSSTQIPVMNASSSITTTNVSFTNIPNTTETSTIETSSTNISTITFMTTTSSLTETISSNETDVNINTCLRKIPFTQEPVPPFRITHTSTLFFQGDQSLVVAGASKFETFFDIGSIERKITINGEIVYRNCQRTIEISLPIRYYCPISS